MKGAKMCQEVFQIAMSMDLKSVEMQLALQCAPLITGARISNMLMIDGADESAMRVILRASGISHFRLAARNEKTAFLLFRRSLLEAYLNNSEALDILKKAGYEDFEKAKESVIQLLAEDIDMRLILEIYKEEPQQIAV
ncbi:MAG: DUF3793 family protein [Agathobacter sp.]|uniref:DUF3793 family protein n=1 Tax=Agathobacter sp. TaxID=2021311 RepID=UPI002E773900|nr:DUF3793 family protein [Agathobacter sp.]MEE1216831.1 DUF3793 family protein [Agathobacter sp.]